MSEAATLDTVLGLRRKGGREVPALTLVRQIADGLPVSALRAVGEAYAPGDKSFLYRIVPKATLARRTERLSPDESDRVARLAQVWRLALDVWKDAEAARAFLTRPHMLLGGEQPLSLVLMNAEGAKLVENILGGLKYSTGV